MAGLKEVLAIMKPKLDTSAATRESNLTVDLGIDSLSMLLMSLALEQKFGVEFDSSKPAFQTVGEVIDYIKNSKQ